IHIDRPAGGTIKDNSKNIVTRSDKTTYHTEDDYTYSPNAVSVGDVDGDGEWEYIVKWTPSNQADNSEQWFTSKTYYDCYKEDGTKLWRIDMGRNIRSGNHYTQFLVYDFDGDGKAEFMVKTAPGTVDGQGKNVLMGSDQADVSYVNNKGVVNNGPEYLTVFNGETGAEISTIAYNPPRSIRSSSQWGDSYNNRSERYLACVAYLDGQHPSAVFCRGYYTAAYLWAVDFDGKTLKERWLHKSETSGQGAYGEGAHSVTVGDVDGDGCDEIIYGACAIDHDGKILHRTGGGHGDALHLADIVPEREGLEVFMVHEEKRKWDAAVRDAKTGEILYSEPASKDNGRGVAANISSKYPGYEWWSHAHVLWAGDQQLSD
ncbi:MAG: Por secretion system protein, partial [Duncaniella sp.]|nr:Por secretion system protein [Duncaniella sp.]